jgi:hypothetical protein
MRFLILLLFITSCAPKSNSPNAVDRTAPTPCDSSSVLSELAFCNDKLWRYDEYDRNGKTIYHLFYDVEKSDVYELRAQYDTGGYRIKEKYWQNGTFLDSMVTAYEFDAKGRRIVEIVHDSEGVSRTCTEYINTGDGMIRWVHNPDSGLKSGDWFIREYFKKGKQVKQEINMSQVNILLYRYDTEGRLDRLIFLPGHDTDYYFYNVKGNNIKKIKYSGSQKQTEENKFDDQGRLVRSVMTTFDQKEKTTRTTVFRHEWRVIRYWP